MKASATIIFKKRRNEIHAMATLENTLEVFETYKQPGDAEKSSDEESIHLVIEADDEKESNDNSPSSIETEEDILNKFDENSKEENKENVPDSEAKEIEKTEDNEVQKSTNETEEVSENATSEAVEQVPKEVEENSPMDVDQPIEEQNETDAAKSTEEIQTSIEKSDSSDSMKDNEELFHISVIRDVDEDNATAIEESNLTTNITEDHEDSGSDKVETEETLEDSSGEQVTHEEVMLDNEVVSSETQVDDSEVQQGESNCEEDKVSSASDDCKLITNEEESEVLYNSAVDTDETIKADCEEIKFIEENIISEIVEEDEKDVNIKTVKRGLSETDLLHSDSKKIKLESNDLKPSKYLASFIKHMQDKKIISQLSFAELEQFCVQKICEVIMHRSIEGKLNEKIKKHEKTIDTLRINLNQVAKQAHDLEIVNKKMMNDLRQQNAKKKLLPLKITRSVGMQVNAHSIEVGNRRKSGGTQNQSSKFISTFKPLNKTILKPASTVQRSQMSSKSPVSSTTSPPQSSLLSQALANPLPVMTNRRSNAVQPAKRSPVSRPKQASLPSTSPASATKTTTTTEQTTAKSSSVIDLTDEDDNIGNNAKSVLPLRVTNRPLVQNIRMTNKITLPGVVTTNAPQLMYVVPANQVTTAAAGGQPKATWVVNFQSTNGLINGNLNTTMVQQQTQQSGNKLHPAPLPVPPIFRLGPEVSAKPVPPKPFLSIRKTDTGIVLQWKMPYNLDLYESIASYQLYAYQETNAVPATEMWRKVGDVKSLALPMACTLTQFADKNKYYFAVRSVDIHKRIGPFSDPEEISL